MLRRTRTTRTAALAVSTGLAAAALTAAPASAAGVTEIPLPTFQVKQVCGPRNDVITVDPTWLATWGDKVAIWPNSLTFQGGADGDTAKPAGTILDQYAGSYVWAGSSATGWDRAILYPGRVTPIVDVDNPCVVEVPWPYMAQTARRGPHNDAFELVGHQAAFWRIVSVTWQGNTATVTAQVDAGLVGPDGRTTYAKTFVDDPSKGTPVN